MVCPKLKKGSCSITKKICSKPYEIKMIRYADCPIFKKGKGAAGRASKNKSKGKTSRTKKKKRR